MATDNKPDRWHSVEFVADLENTLAALKAENEECNKLLAIQMDINKDLGDACADLYKEIIPLKSEIEELKAENERLKDVRDIHMQTIDKLNEHHKANKAELLEAMKDMIRKKPEGHEYICTSVDEIYSLLSKHEVK